uniref:Cytochrome c biogenesis protein CcsB n=1 Tax=Spermothamnion repens TaxID=31383 RepID=A0A4D6X0Y7_9FLOR|nr:cytochrome c biogenesis protein ccs1 [Spermothamnion repens]
MFKNFVWNIVKKLANLNFAIFILFCIVFLSILGSIIEQKQGLIFYQINYPIQDNKLFYLNWKFILFLGLDNIYESWWFILIILIFIASLLTCTFAIQLPSLKYARRWKFIKTLNKNNQDNIYKNNLYINNNMYNSFINMIYSLSNSSFYIFYQGNKIYAYKGLFGRIAPIFVHFSIIITLFGSILGLFLGFIDQEIISSGELFHFKNIVKSGRLSNIPNNFLGRVNNFFVTYHSNGSIKQFFSDISILNNQGSIITNKIIAVNSPLKFNFLTFYQTDWKINGLRFHIADDYIIQKKLQEVTFNNRKCWISNLILDQDNKYVVFLFDLQNKFYIYDANTDKVISLSLNQSIYLNDIKFSIMDTLVSTGLYIKTDPGVIIVYSGFFIVMISTTVSYISYTQIWINRNNMNLSFIGSTNRAILFFEEDMNQIDSVYQKYNY